MTASCETVQTIRLIEIIGPVTLILAFGYMIRALYVLQRESKRVFDLSDKLRAQLDLFYADPQPSRHPSGPPAFEGLPRR